MSDNTSPALLDRALIEEAAKKSGLLWVAGQDGGPAVGLWHIWHEGAVCLVGGPGEQPLRGLPDGGTARVTVRSKDKGGRLVAFDAAVEELAPRSERWTAVVEELKGKRLNAPDFAGMTERWADTCRVLRLVPGDRVPEGETGSGAAVPPPTPATTREPMPGGLPGLLLRRKRPRGGKSRKS